ncbi:MAG TPA: hypothetical protein VE933_04170 [Chitinophagaceae bacterium]|nr:hypothetical protein [Chitinophagaceae bacterium]
MFTTLFIDGALKLVQIIRYKNKPATARIYDPRATVPEGIFLKGSAVDAGGILFVVAAGIRLLLV